MYNFYGLFAIIFLKITLNRASELISKDCVINECIEKPYGHKISDPSDCHGYQLCHGEFVLQQYCAPGFIFVEAIQDCIFGKCPPCKCQGPTTPTTTPTITPTTTPTTTPTITLTSIPNTPFPITPPADSISPDCSQYEHGRRLPNSKHCRWFWQCVEGQAVALFCELGMWYDHVNYVCNFRSSVKNCSAMQD